MPVQFGNLITLIASHAGIDPTDPALADLQSIHAKVSDDLYHKIQHWTDNQLTIESAKNLPELDRHYRQRTLNPIDTELTRMSEELGLSDDARTALTNEKSTYRRIRLFTDLLRAHYDAAHHIDKEQMAQQQLTALATLQAKLDSQENEKNTAIATQQQRDTQRLIRYALRSYLDTQQYADDTIDRDTLIATATQLLDRDLSERQLSLSIDDHDRLLLLTTDNAPYTEHQTEISFGDYADRLLAARTMLRTTDLAAPAAGITLPTHIPITDLPRSNQAALSEIDRMLAGIH